MKASLAIIVAPLLLCACSSVTVETGAAAACRIDMPLSPGPGGEGVVFEVLDQATAMRLLVRTQAQVGAPINGAYINNVRVGVRRPNGASATVLIPYGMRIAVGDHVAYQGGYRSPGLPCSYIPNLATRKF